MFDHTAAVVGLWPGERPDEDVDLAYELTCRQSADGWVDDDRDVLPTDLEDMAAGPFLAAVVSSVDPSRLNGHDAVRLMQARARLSSHHEAGKYEAMAEVAYSPPTDPDSGVLRSSEEVEYAALEVAAALTLTRRASEDQLGRAVVLTDRLPRVLESFSAGLLDLPRVRIFESQLSHLPPEAIDTVLDEILHEAPGLTTGQLRARLDRLVLEADPGGSRSSYEEGLAERRVAVSSNPDHTANFGLFSGPPEEVCAAREHVEYLARSLKTESEPRTLDQLRHDVALGLLQGRHHDSEGGPASGGGVNVTVAAETLARLSDAPGDLDGYGPVLAEIARKTVMENVDGEWIFTVTDQGRPVATGTLSRRPTRSQRRQISASYPTCVFPGCRHPAHRCDLDHRRPHSLGGPTHNDNLGPLCRHHHMARHHGYWTLQRLDDGDHRWTSPLGHTYFQKRGPPG